MYEGLEVYDVPLLENSLLSKGCDVVRTNETVHPIQSTVWDLVDPFQQRQGLLHMDTTYIQVYTFLPCMLAISEVSSIMYQTYFRPVPRGLATVDPPRLALRLSTAGAVGFFASDGLFL